MHWWTSINMDSWLNSCIILMLVTSEDDQSRVIVVQHQSWHLDMPSLSDTVHSSDGGWIYYLIMYQIRAQSGSCRSDQSQSIWSGDTDYYYHGQSQWWQQPWQTLITVSQWWSISGAVAMKSSSWYYFYLLWQYHWLLIEIQTNSF